MINYICRIGRKISKLCLFFILAFSVTTSVFAQTKAMWVGETFKCDATSALLGLTSDVQWTTSGGYFSLSGSGYYRNVTITQYFSGTASVTCTWRYKLYYNDTQKTQSKTWTFSCNENPLKLSTDKLTVAPGGSAQIMYGHTYNNQYSTTSNNVTFSSGDPRIATVSNSGLVTGVSLGTTYINVYSKLANPTTNGYGMVSVTVKEIPATGVSLPSTLSIGVGDTHTLVPTLSPAGAISTFSWSSDDTKIATVSEDGVVKGIKPGQTKITVKTKDGKHKAQCTVTVKEQPTQITLDGPIKVYKDFSYTLVPKIKPENTETELTWKSSDEFVAKVTSSGVVLGEHEGKATITVTTKNNIQAKCEVTVLPLPANLKYTDIYSYLTRVKIITAETVSSIFKLK